MGMAKPVLILTTIGSREAAETLAESFVKERLAACVSIAGPVLSIYHWQGAIERGEEFQLTLKSLDTHLAAIESRLKSFHASRPDGYQLPELLVVPLGGGSMEYLAWLQANVHPA